VFSRQQFHPSWAWYPPTCIFLLYLYHLFCLSSDGKMYLTHPPVPKLFDCFLYPLHLLLEKPK
jgi:hypothetical protein